MFVGVLHCVPLALVPEPPPREKNRIYWAWRHGIAHGV